MRKYVLGAMACIALVPWMAVGQSVEGWSRAIGSYDPVQTGKIMMPQPDWSLVSDIENTDGTANPPPCYDTDVMSTVGGGVLQYEAQSNGGLLADGTPIFTEVSFGDVWVHKTDSGRYVCDTEIQSNIKGNTTLPITPEKWEFETFADDGQNKVFFYDVSQQNTGQN